MATAVAPGEYTLVYLVFNTISNLLTQAEQVACFRNAARHLTPGGRFVIELWVPELRKLPPGQQATVWHVEPGYIGLDTYDVLRQHVVSHHFRFDEGRQARLFRSPHRYIWPAELDLMAQLAGFELESQARGLGRSRVHRRVAVARVRLPHPAEPLASPVTTVRSSGVAPRVRRPGQRAIQPSSTGRGKTQLTSLARRRAMDDQWASTANLSRP